MRIAVPSLKDTGALGLYVALIEGYRKSMYPEIRVAFNEFTLCEDWGLVEAARKSGCEKFLSLRTGVLKAFRAGMEKERLPQEIKELLSSHPEQ